MSQPKTVSRFRAGSKLVEQGDHEKAIFEFTKAIFLCNTEAKYYHARATAYINCCDFRSAVMNLRKVVNLNDDNGHEDIKTRMLLSSVLDAQGHLKLDHKDYSAAHSMFTEAIQLDPHKVQCYFHRCVALCHLGHWEEAFTDADSACRVSGHNADAFILRGKLHWKLKVPTLLL